MVSKRNTSRGWIAGKCVLAFVLPPLSVGLTTGMLTRPWGINLSLTLLGFAAAPFHALYVIFKYKDRDYVRHSKRVAYQ